jgi:hypothetical protein
LIGWKLKKNSLMSNKENLKLEHHEKNQGSWALVAHACSPSYLEG